MRKQAGGRWEGDRETSQEPAMGRGRPCCCRSGTEARTLAGQVEGKVPGAVSVRLGTDGHSQGK